MMDNARSVKNYNKVMSRSINKQLWVCFPAVSVCLLYRNENLNVLHQLSLIISGTPLNMCEFGRPAVL